MPIFQSTQLRYIKDMGNISIQTIYLVFLFFYAAAIDWLEKKQPIWRPQPKRSPRKGASNLGVVVVGNLIVIRLLKLGVIIRLVDSL